MLRISKEMADSYFTLSSSVVVKADNKVKPIVLNRLYRINQKKTWNEVFDEVTDPEEVDLKKTDQILTTVSDRAGQTFELKKSHQYHLSASRQGFCSVVVSAKVI
jgi:hypothetical protein